MVAPVTYNWPRAGYGARGFAEYCSLLVASVSNAQIHHQED